MEDDSEMTLIRPPPSCPCIFLSLESRAGRFVAKVKEGTAAPPQHVAACSTIGVFHVGLVAAMIFLESNPGLGTGI